MSYEERLDALGLYTLEKTQMWPLWDKGVQDYARTEHCQVLEIGRHSQHKRTQSQDLQTQDGEGSTLQAGDLLPKSDRELEQATTSSGKYVSLNQLL